MTVGAKETWGSGNAYEQYVGRWSRPVAREFLGWLNLEPGLRWGDVGCGTGALAECILAGSDPPRLSLMTAPRGLFVPHAKGSKTRESSLIWAMPWQSLGAMATEMVRVTRPGGTVGAYVWDYGRGMQMMRHFWDVAVQINPHDSKLDQAERFPICQPELLANLFREVGLNSVSVRTIDVPTVFRDFDDYWTPLFGEAGCSAHIPCGPGRCRP